ncbi:iron-sulfur cluster repair di-iron protein [Rhodoblastus acidophilus]|uniref:Iron-sulfur cluster repair di-iron protein n=1 Tax=Candidatus Rhodoblastus alkanivorans TaxID=2954117 RepID=A0ABS9Z293_9HYPH|nr:iron-sulfur cluster repair di-iron protein [Candidatus Rhodoblastus alkanivorans]MCI4677431.1 iron-sulfur cluster repair di-iron protein [Candidatus Rhodoblastus alkanivorans]MCI4681790.1 iron-sulfur cluster repair di-iron protein [Candidatus Rhodoblastus alkanivorans]MDI4642840.1 iron-sulfur cluster repair di-iron protein [Rhodoblastus acidophilus]
MTETKGAERNFGAIPIGEIAVRAPGATAIFRKYKLDYCCNGGASLAEAVRKRGLELGDIEHQIAALLEQPGEPPRETEELIEFIITRFHDTHRREFPELIQLARRVERVHAHHPQAPKGLAQFLERISADLETHMEKEELVLFPLMRAHHPGVSAPIAAMRAEHVDHGDALAALATATHDMQAPQGACGSWLALYAGLKKLSDDLVEHIHVENNMLFPRFIG